MENRCRMYLFRERWSKWYSAKLSCIFKWLSWEHGHFSLCLIHARRTVGSNVNVKTDQNTPPTSHTLQTPNTKTDPPPRPNSPCKLNHAAPTHSQISVYLSFVFFSHLDPWTKTFSGTKIKLPWRRAYSLRSWTSTFKICKHLLTKVSISYR